jgi:lambda family phage portal protein
MMSVPYDSEEFYNARVRQQAFEGAVTNYRMEQKGLVAGDADVLAARELQLLWQRSHHAVRNNGWAKTAKRKNLINLNSINVKWKDDKGKVNKKMQAIWDEFAKDPNLDGYGTLDNTQEAWNGAMFESGEALCRMIIKKRDGFTVPLVLQNIESEYLDPIFQNKDPLTTRNSIKFVDSKPSIYYFSKRNPGFTQFSAMSMEKVEVAAEEVLHIFIRDRPGQWRGVPTLAPILLPLYELDDLTDATVAKQKAAQAISWVIRNTNPSSAMAVGSALNTVDPNDIDKSTGKRRVVSQASGGGVQYLNKGEDIAFYQGTDIGANLPELIKAELHKIAQTAGLSYEVLTGDLTGISFSALQQVAIDMKTQAEFMYKFYIINLGLAPLCKRFQELAVIYGSKNFANLTPTFQYPRKYGVNDLKDAQADLLEVQSGFATWESKLEERNLTVEEITEDKKRQSEAGVSFEPSVPTSSQSKNVKPNSNSAGM